MKITIELSGLGGALSQQYERVQRRFTKKRSIDDNDDLITRLDSLEDAIVKGLKRSRSRTFGSNY